MSNKIKLPKERKAGEKGQTLIFTLILLSLVSIIMAPLLNFMASGAKTTEQVYNQGAKELYAADAGIRDAMWNIERSSSWLPAEGETTVPQTIPEPVNGKTVTYSITRLLDSIYQPPAYQIQSQSFDPLNSGTTTISCEVTTIDFFETFTENALTSPTSISTKRNAGISGNVQSPLVDGNSDGTINADLENGSVINSDVFGWPQITSRNNPIQLYYLIQVSNLTPFTGPNINLSNGAQRGPLYVDNGDPDETYAIMGSGALSGTIYINGNLIFNNHAQITLGSGNVGQTIFVTGSVTFTMPQSVVSGPGSIISNGYLNFQPNVVNNGQYIYLMSVNSYVNFYGSIAGKTYVNIQPNADSTITWMDSGNLNLNLPGRTDTGIASIESWQIR